MKQYEFEKVLEYKEEIERINRLIKEVNEENNNMYYNSSFKKMNKKEKQLLTVVLNEELNDIYKEIANMKLEEN